MNSKQWSSLYETAKNSNFRLTKKNIELQDELKIKIKALELMSIEIIDKALLCEHKTQEKCQRILVNYYTKQARKE